MKILHKLFGLKTKTNAPGNEEVQDPVRASTELIAQALRILDDHSSRAYTDFHVLAVLRRSESADGEVGEQR